MNRRLLIRSGIACAAICVLAWRLPGMLDGALSSIDQHKGTIALLQGDGRSLTTSTTTTTDGSVRVLGAASSLSPAERARLLEAARKNDPLAQAQAKLGARVAAKPAPNAQPKPIPSTDSTGLDPSLVNTLRALGMDPSTMDLSSVDLDALLAKARDLDPKP